jgi:1-acyl-sn-glycerol-3-phosphate acyltransferase
MPEKDTTDHYNFLRKRFTMAFFFLTMINFFRFYFRVRVVNRHIRKQVKPWERPVIVVFNHASHLDIPLIGIGFGYRISTHLRAAGKKELFNSKWVAWLWRWLGVIPVDRERLDMDSARKIIGILKKGHSIMIAPEGTRSETGEVGEFNDSFIKLAQKTGALIAPIGIQGSNRAMPKGATFPRPKKITVRLGEPLDLQQIPADELRSKAKHAELSEKIRQQIIELCSRDPENAA